MLAAYLFVEIDEHRRARLDVQVGRIQRGKGTGRDRGPKVHNPQDLRRSPKQDTADNRTEARRPAAMSTNDGADERALEQSDSRATRGKQRVQSRDQASTVSCLGGGDSEQGAGFDRDRTAIDYVQRQRAIVNLRTMNNKEAAFC